MRPGPPETERSRTGSRQRQSQKVRARASQCGPRRRRRSARVQTVTPAIGTTRLFGHSLGRLSRWLLLGEWRAHPLRAIMAIAAIAVGISLGFAIHLINAAAFNEFSSAIKGLSGVADVQVSGTEAFLDEGIYPR